MSFFSVSTLMLPASNHYSLLSLPLGQWEIVSLRPLNWLFNPLAKTSRPDGRYVLYRTIDDLQMKDNFPLGTKQ